MVIANLVPEGYQQGVAAVALLQQLLSLHSARTLQKHARLCVSSCKAYHILFLTAVMLLQLKLTIQAHSRCEEHSLSNVRPVRGCRSEADGCHGMLVQTPLPKYAHVRRLIQKSRLLTCMAKNKAQRADAEVTDLQ